MTVGDVHAAPKDAASDWRRPPALPVADSRRRAPSCDVATDVQDNRRAGEKAAADVEKITDGAVVVDVPSVVESSMGGQ